MSAAKQSGGTETMTRLRSADAWRMEQIIARPGHQEPDNAVFDIGPQSVLVSDEKGIP
jgi:hypothetical protein